MKKYLFTIMAGYMFLLCACDGKDTLTPTQSNNINTDNTGNTGGTAGTGGTGNTNSYVVKTIGVGRIVLGVDNSFKLTVAEIYGGGNHVILKAGTGNTMSIAGANIGTIPDAVGYPDGVVPYTSQAIDNGNPPTDTTGNSATVIKLKGFDKSKAGYNQLNLVMSPFTWAIDNNSAGYHTNLTYTRFNRTTGSKNADYGIAFLNKVFSGNISVTDVEIAAPKSAHPYITQDQIASYGQSSYDPVKGLTGRLDIGNLLYSVQFFKTNSNNLYVGSPIKMEWVNANTGTIAKLDPYVYTATFTNIKTGGSDMVVDPVDSTSKVFLRISGLDPAVCGFNQLRLFIASDGFYDGSLQVIFSALPTTAPTLSFIKSTYIVPNLYCNTMRPNWPHY